MTDKKKPLPPSMRVAAATQKLSKAELDVLLKEAAKATAEGAAEDDDGLLDGDDDAAPAKKAPAAPAKKAKK
jgi:hypothetical protein